jgi:hypothetical protein
MKKLVFFSLAFVVYACTDVVDLEVPESAPELVINAQINNQKGTEAYLSLTAPFFTEEAVEPVSNAIITLYQNDSAVSQLVEVDTLAGFYTSDFKGVPGQSYRLSVSVVGDYPELSLGTWESALEPMPSAPTIDSLVISLLNRQTVPSVFNEGYYVQTYFQEIPNERNFYRIRRWLNDSAFAREIFVIEDQGIDGIYFGGPIFPAPAFYGPFDEQVPGEPRDSVTIEISTINEGFAEYLGVIQQQTTVGSPFDAPPALILGNWRKQDDPDQFCFGYFHATAQDAQGITFNR